MLRSIFVISSALLALSACGSGGLSANDHAFLKAVDSVCGPSPTDDRFPDRLCEAYLVYADVSTPVAKLSGVTIGERVAAHLTWRVPASGRVLSGAFYDEPDRFAKGDGRIVGPTDHDWPIIKARYLEHAGRAG